VSIDTNRLERALRAAGCECPRRLRRRKNAYELPLTFKVPDHCAGIGKRRDGDGQRPSRWPRCLR